MIRSWEIKIFRWGAGAENNKRPLELNAIICFTETNIDVDIQICLYDRHFILS